MNQGPIDKVRFINVRKTEDIFSYCLSQRPKKDQWDALIVYADGRTDYHQILAPNKIECANALRKKGLL